VIVLFVDVGRIVDHHYLNFLFIAKYKTIIKLLWHGKKGGIYWNNSGKAGLHKFIITMYNKVSKTIEFYSIIMYSNTRKCILCVHYYFNTMYSETGL